VLDECMAPNSVAKLTGQGEEQRCHLVDISPPLMLDKC